MVIVLVLMCWLILIMCRVAIVNESGECDATGVKRSEQIVESLIDIVIFIYIKDNFMQKAVRS